LNIAASRGCKKTIILISEEMLTSLLLPADILASDDIARGLKFMKNMVQYAKQLGNLFTIQY